MKPYTFKIGGEAGFGITSAGLAFSKIAARSGYYTFDYMEYPSLIRGGHNVVQTCFATEPVLAPYQHTDFLVALNQETIDFHKHELAPDAIVMYDTERKMQVSDLPDSIIKLDLPAARLAREIGGTMLMRDTVVIGAAIALMQGDIKIFYSFLAQAFASKGKTVIKENQDTAKAGYDYVQKNFKQHCKPVLVRRKKIPKQLVMNGNECAALGAVAAGLQFVSIYPMTPTSNILQVLAPLQKEFGFIYKQPEDEISAINMAIGASFAGARAMTATAGGGFCLMTEGYGLAGITETPLVIIEGMRPGPATGLPTWTSQGDLQFMLHAHQDDFPRIILTPGDMTEVFDMTMQAFNLADMYQTPVVVMIDKHLCESHQSIPLFDYRKYNINRGKFSTKKINKYARYALSADGISLRVPAGTGTHVIANSDEHDPEGFSTESADMRNAQMKKRMQKLQTCAERDMPEPTLYGPKNAELTIVSWGSNKGAILEALKTESNVNFLHLTWMNPFPTAAVQKVLERAKVVLNVELNYTGQLASLIAEKTGIVTDQFLKYDGRPLFPEELVQKIQQLKKANKILK